MAYSDDDSTRPSYPTIKPDFDLTAYAKDTAVPMRERANTLSDEEATEQARLASVLMSSIVPPSSEPDPRDAIRARLAPMSRVPALAKSLPELGAAIQEPRTAYVLGFVDGLLPLETIVDVTGLPELDTLQILDRLVTAGAIIFPRP